MKTEFTPGPWRVDGLLIKAIDHGKWFGIAKAGGSKLNIEGNMANARLIAAAPDMFAALQNLEAWINGYAQDYIPNARFHQTGGFDVMESARNALAKATGHE